MFAQDAPRELALARERRLQSCRDQVLEDGPLDLESIDWISQLAGAGHVPAQALVDRAFHGDRLRRLREADPGRFDAVARRVPRLAGWLAACECARDPMDLAVVRAWLALGDPPCRAIASALAQVEALGIALSTLDRQQVAKTVQSHWNASLDDSRIPSNLLTAFAEPRFADADPGVRAEGLALLRHAGSLAPGGARRWAWLYDLAARSAYMRNWLEKFPVPSSRDPNALMRAALDYETGAAGDAPDLEVAAVLYEMGTNVPVREGESAGALGTEFCLAVGRWLDWQSRPEDRAMRESAMGWYGRVVGRGDPRALGLWLVDAADPKCAAARDPGQVLAEIERYLAAERPGTDREPLARGGRVMLTRAEKLLESGDRADAALAAGWLRAVARLGEPESQFRLALLHFNGNPAVRDRELAVRLLRSSAAQGHAKADEALARIAAATRARPPD